MTSVRSWTGPVGLAGAGWGAGTFGLLDWNVSSERLMFTDMENKSWFVDDNCLFMENKDAFEK
jgi:hypothetical protein